MKGRSPIFADRAERCFRRLWSWWFLLLSLANAVASLSARPASGAATAYADKTFARTNTFVVGQNTVSATSSTASGKAAGDLCVVTLTGAGR